MSSATRRVNAAARLGYGLWLSVCACSSAAPDAGSNAGRPGLIVAGSGYTGRAGTSGAGVGGGSTVVKDPARCIEGNVDAARVTPRVILVLDGSCSMTTDYPASGAASATECRDNTRGRWSALRRALVDPQSGVVPKLQHAVRFGAVVYGTEPRCPIPNEPVRPALNNLTAIEGSLPRVQPGMFTPTGPALDWVYENLITEDTPDGDNSRQIVILATDGEPNSCGGGGGRGQGATTNYQPSIDAVNKGTKLGVTTYVISLADATGAFHDHLQQLANLGNPSAGGSAKLYEPSSPEELGRDLGTLIGGAVSCDIALSGSLRPGTECTGTVSLNGSPLPCNQPDGYRLLDARHIRVEGKACQTLMESPSSGIEARFPCDSLGPD